MHKNAGFTMIEMVAVCLIITVILAVGIPSYFRSAEIAKCREAMRTLNTMVSAGFDFYAENNTFTGLTVAAINAQSGVNIINNADWTYGVAVAGGGTTFTVTSTRLKGPHGAGSTIILDQDYTWAGTYPYTDPGNF